MLISKCIIISILIFKPTSYIYIYKYVYIYTCPGILQSQIHSIFLCLYTHTLLNMQRGWQLCVWHWHMGCSDQADQIIRHEPVAAFWHVIKFETVRWQPGISHYISTLSSLKAFFCQAILTRPNAVSQGILTGWDGNFGAVPGKSSEAPHHPHRKGQRQSRLGMEGAWLRASWWGIQWHGPMGWMATPQIPFFHNGTDVIIWCHHFFPQICGLDDAKNLQETLYLRVNTVVSCTLYVLKKTYWDNVFLNCKIRTANIFKMSFAVVYDSFVYLSKKQGAFQQYMWPVTFGPK